LAANRLTPEARAWPAPAKINLFLHIVGRRADGYHNLQTVFQFLDHGDDVFIAPRRDGTIRRTGEIAGVAEADDLSVRGARALQARVGGTPGCDIRIEKRLPLGGGLGGGSSDAATTLVVLNRLWDLQLADDALAEIGLKLGADVPVFVRGFAAWGEGLGERLQPVAPPEPWYLVVTPPCAVDTKAAFAAPELSRNTPPIRWDDYLAGQGRNDFLPVVRKQHPQIAAAMEWLGTFGKPRLSGSGASVFADFSDRAGADTAMRQLPKGWRAFIARGRNRSPLHTALEEYNSRA